MTARLLAVVFEGPDPEAAARFWGGLLGREAAAAPLGVLLAGDAVQVGLGFAAQRSAKRGPDRVHLHLTSTSAADQERTVAAALALGARHLDVGQRPEEGHVVLSGPGEDELCVIEPDNSFLAGCGRLGEVACDGGREVGRFWAAALAWPLVWDQGEETAIQAPAGGTKIAWGGPPDAPPTGPDRQRFELVVDPDEHDAEVRRLLALGARPLPAADDGATALADPGGYELRVRRAVRPAGPA